MLELQKIFLLVTCFFCLTTLRLECSRSRKTTSFLSDITQAEKMQNSASTELHEWSENMANIENCQLKFLKENCAFLSYLSKMKIVSVITLLYSSKFYSLVVPFFVLEI